MRRMIASACGVAAAATIVAGAASAGAKSNTVTANATARHSGTTLNLVAYSTPGPVYGSQSTPGTLENAFAKTKAGQGATFNNSFAASDQQANAVANGQPADVVNFSYAPNVAVLVNKRLVATNWWNNPYNGDITRSVVAFGVRPGNPKHIKGWGDLIKGGVGVVTPSTALSGGAKWNILGGYAYASRGGKSSKAGISYLRALKKNIVDEPSSASKSVAAFLLGTGDVVIGYQDDLYTAATANPGKLLVITPSQSLLIENPIAVTKRSASHNPVLAKAFLTFLYSSAAQTIWAKNHYWPVVQSVYNKYKKTWTTPKTIYTAKKLGGWAKLDGQFFGTPNGIWTKIENGG